MHWCRLYGLALFLVACDAFVAESADGFTFHSHTGRPGCMHCSEIAVPEQVSESIQHNGHSCFVKPLAMVQHTLARSRSNIVSHPDIDLDLRLWREGSHPPAHWPMHSLPLYPDPSTFLQNTTGIVKANASAAADMTPLDSAIANSSGMEYSVARSLVLNSEPIKANASAADDMTSLDKATGNSSGMEYSVARTFVVTSQPNGYSVMRISTTENYQPPPVARRTLVSTNDTQAANSSVEEQGIASQVHTSADNATNTGQTFSGVNGTDVDSGSDGEKDASAVDSAAIDSESDESDAVRRKRNAFIFGATVAFHVFLFVAFSGACGTEADSGIRSDDDSDDYWGAQRNVGVA